MTRGPPGAGVVVGKYAYDSVGWRNFREEGGSKVNSFWADGNLAEDRDATSNAILAHYHHADGNPFAVDDGDEVRYYHQDALGTTLALSNDVGAPTAQYRVGPFGDLKNSSGSDAGLGRFLFTGHEFDSGTGLTYARARYYDSETGGFLSQDSSAGEFETPYSLGRYAYGYHNPLRFIDPTGNTSVDTEIDQQAVAAAKGGNVGRLALYSAFRGAYEIANFASFGFMREHDKARDAYDTGQSSFEDYVVGASKAGGKAGVLGLGTLATGGGAALGAKALGWGVLSQGAVGGLAAGLSAQGIEDAYAGEISNWKQYGVMGGAGLLLGAGTAKLVSSPLLQRLSQEGVGQGIATASEELTTATARLRARLKTAFSPSTTEAPGGEQPFNLDMDPAQFAEFSESLDDGVRFAEHAGPNRSVAQTPPDEFIGPAEFNGPRLANGATSSNLAPGEVAVVHPNVPEWRPGDPARGVLRYGDVEVPLQSGVAGPGEALKGLPGGKGTGLNAQIPSHVEGHVAGMMHSQGIMEADLFINKAPCGTGAMCRFNLHKILPKGSKLRVHFPGENGKTQRWTFEHGKPKWTEE